MGSLSNDQSDAPRIRNKRKGISDQDREKSAPGRIYAGAQAVRRRINFSEYLQIQPNTKRSFQVRQFPGVQTANRR